MDVGYAMDRGDAPVATSLALFYRSGFHPDLAPSGGIQRSREAFATQVTAIHLDLSRTAGADAVVYGDQADLVILLKNSRQGDIPSCCLCFRNITVIGGFVSSTLLTLIIVPVVYALFFRGGAKREAAAASMQGN